MCSSVLAAAGDIKSTNRVAFVLMMLQRGALEKSRFGEHGSCQAVSATSVGRGLPVWAPGAFPLTLWPYSKIPHQSVCFAGLLLCSLASWWRCPSSSFSTDLHFSRSHSLTWAIGLQRDVTFAAIFSAPLRLRLCPRDSSALLLLDRSSDLQSLGFFLFSRWLLILFLCYSFLVFWHSQRQVQILVVSGRPGVRETLEPQNLLHWGKIRQINIYKMIHMEHFSENMLDACWLVLPSITSHSAGCPSSPSCVLSPHSPREL